MAIFNLNYEAFSAFHVCRSPCRHDVCYVVQLSIPIHMTEKTPARKKKSIVFRIFMWTGIVVVLLIGLLIATPFLFKDKLVELAKKEANKQLNAKVDFGEFHLSLFKSFPDFRFDIENVSIVGVNEFAGDTLLGL